MRHLIITLLLCSIGLTVAATPIEFLQLTTDNGLVSNQIESIFKDSRGFLWVGSNAGVSRYDGYRFTHYPLGKKNSRTLNLEAVCRIQEDAQGNLWFEDTYQSLLYLYNEDIFVNNMDSLFRSMGLQTIPTAITIDDNGDLWLAANEGGIYHFSLNNDNVTYIKQDGLLNHFSPGNIVSIKVKNNFVWVLHNSGLLERYNLMSATVDLRDNYFSSNSLFSVIKKNLFIDKDNDPWVFPGIGDIGTSYLDTRANSWVNLGKENARLSSFLIRALAQDSEGTMWISSDHGGLNLYNKKSGEVQVLKHDIYNKHSICQNSIISLYYDDEGVMWAGSYKNGLSHYHKHLFKFHEQPDMQMLNSKFYSLDCNVLLVDKKGRLWIGTNGQGIIRYDKTNNEYKLFLSEKNNLNTISSDIITAITEDSKGVIWIGTFLGGINSISQSDKVTQYRPEQNSPNFLSNKSVYEIYEDDLGYLWLATLGSGLDRLNPERNRFDHFSISNTKGMVSDYNTSIHKFNGDKFFTCAAAGISVVDVKTNKVQTMTEFTQMPEFDEIIQVNSVLTDSRGMVWIATKYGIALYKPNSSKLIAIKLNDGTTGKDIVSLIEDNNGNIWAGTQGELLYIQCNPKGTEFTYKINSFNKEDGLIGNTFNPNSTYKDLKGNIFMGTTSGVIEIDPNCLSINETKPVSKFSALFVNNKEIKPGDELTGKVVLTRHISESKKITLPYNQTNFTLHFSTFNYARPVKCQFRYLLKGLDNDYVTLPQGKNSVSFSNLNPGKYELLVYAANEDQVWSETPIALEIDVIPPFWKRWWAYLFYGFVIAMVVWLIFRSKLNRQKELFEKDKRTLEATKQHELDEMKISFFTNISHEFKTPLTLILSPVQKMLQENPTSEQKMLLQMMQRNATNLMELVSDLLDFRKLDIQKLTLNRSTGDIVSYVKEVCQNFTELAKEKHITMSFTAHFPQLYMDFDAKKMHKVVTNLLSNAIKYTPSGGKVEVVLSKVEQMTNNTEQLLLTVTDSGIGIAPEDKIRIFERFHRAEEADTMASGTGIGLHMASEYVKLHNGQIQVQSNLGKGSTFQVTIPIFVTQMIEHDVITTSQEKEDSSINKRNEEGYKEKEMPILLIADDNPDFRNFIKGLFVNSYQVITAQDGEEAYERALELFPDIILSDIMMPHMDGYELCRKIKGDIRTSHIPVILLTAKDSEESHFEGISVGADDYISKPFNIEMLSLKIAKIVEKQKQRQDSFKKKIHIPTSEIDVESMDEKFVKKAVELVEQNMSNPDFLVGNLCEEMNMSRVYFYKKILALTDKTPSEFIRYIRLQRAAELLEKSQMFVNEVAYQVGFNDAKYFRKYFKEEFGITPVEYKKRYVNNEASNAS